MKRYTLPAALIAAIVTGCAAPTEPTTNSEPTIILHPVVTTVPIVELPPGVSVASVTPQFPPTQVAGGPAGSGIASTAVVSPPLTTLPGEWPTPTPPPTPQGNPGDTITVTQSDRDATIMLRVGQSFLLYLNPPGGPDMIWTVTIADEAIVGRMKDVTLPEGAQGYFTGLKPGQTELMAVGDFSCRNSTPPCMAPSMLFQVQIVVQ